VISLKNKSHRVTAEIEVPAGPCHGVIAAQGGIAGGWSLYIEGGVPHYCYNFYGVDLFYVRGRRAMAAGTHVVRMQFDYDGGGVAKGGMARLFVDGESIGEGRIGRTQPLPFASDEPFEIGTDGGSPVTPEYSARHFTGEVKYVELEIPPDARDHDAEVPADDRLAVVFTKA
jgi:arylsulfatase